MDGSVIFYIILFTVIIIVNIVNANKKKQKKLEEYKKRQQELARQQQEMENAEQQTASTSQPEPKTDPLTEFLRKAFEESEEAKEEEEEEYVEYDSLGRPIEYADNEEEISEVEETSTYSIAEDETEEEPEQGVLDEIMNNFDMKKAVIYSEILAKKY